MKKLYHTSVWSIFSLCLCLLWVTSACKDSNEAAGEELAFQIIKTSPKLDYHGGTVTIETNRHNITAVSDAKWLTPSVEGNMVKISVAANDSYGSRTAMLTISHGTERQSLPITQLGIISFIDIWNHQFSFEGGTMSYVWRTDQPYKINIEDESWLSYTVKGEEIIFTAQPNNVPRKGRTNKVVITIGEFYSQDVTFSQEAPRLLFKHIPGIYTLTYCEFIGEKEKTKDVTLEVNKVGESFTMKGLPFDIVVLFDGALPGLRIKGQPVSESVWWSPWQGGNQGGGLGLWPSSKFGVQGTWNDDMENLEFIMVNDGVVDDNWKVGNGSPEFAGQHVICPGFILWSLDNKEYAGAKGETRYVNLKLTKKKATE